MTDEDALDNNHIYYIVEKDQFWLGFYNVGNFIGRDFNNKPITYIYIGEL